MTEAFATSSASIHHQKSVPTCLTPKFRAAAKLRSGPFPNLCTLAPRTPRHCRGGVAARTINDDQLVVTTLHRAECAIYFRGTIPDEHK